MERSQNVRIVIDDQDRRRDGLAIHLPLFRQARAIGCQQGWTSGKPLALVRRAEGTYPGLQRTTDGNKCGKVIYGRSRRPCLRQARLGMSEPALFAGWLRTLPGLRWNLSRRDDPFAGQLGAGGDIHDLAGQARSSSTERGSSFWKWGLAQGFHFCQGCPQGLCDQPGQRQTRAPIHGIP